MISKDWKMDAGPQRDHGKPYWQLFEDRARIAIAAMREPTQEMYDAVSANGKMWRDTNSTEVYRAMIDAASK